MTTTTQSAASDSDLQWNIGADGLIESAVNEDDLVAFAKAMMSVAAERNGFGWHRNDVSLDQAADACALTLQRLAAH